MQPNIHPQSVLMGPWVLVQFGQRNQGGSLDVIEHIIINDLGDE
jgi:hypothetical protein